MTKLYNIQGMTCEGCVVKVKNALEQLNEIKNVDIQLVSPQAKITFNKTVSVPLLQKSIEDYRIHEASRKSIENEFSTQLPEKSLKAYKPLILTIIFIVGVSLLAQYPFDNFSGMLWMRQFMAGFFIVFAFFKLLNIEGFIKSYKMYDIVAAKWNGWGYVYPFVELGLGIFYLLNIAPIFTSWVTLIVLGISSIGVIQSVLDKRKIKCACLGDVFNLPMSTVTIVEDLTMVTMAGIMILF